MARSPKRVVFLVLLAMAAIELGVLITVYLARSSDDTAASTVASDLPAPPKPVDVEQPPDPALNTNRVDPAERSPAASDRQAIDLAATSSATLRAGDGTVLHVRVVAKDGSPLTSGRIDCDWKGRRKADTPRGLVSANISGIITDVLLPPIAETCAVTASLPARLPARVELAGFRRKALELAPMIGRVDCDVRVTLVDTIAGPTLSGVIIVNGEKRVPDGIDIIVDSVSGNALVNRADATYVVPRLPHGAPKSVRVESDENMPHSFGDPEADADGNWKLDLALKSRRSLHVRAVDTSTSGPAQFVELVLDVGTSRIVHKSTDAGGECVFRGLPERGTVRLYDARQRRGLEAPLFSMSLSPDTPDENLARVSMNAPRARVWGSVPTQLLAGRGGSRTSAVRRARSREPGGPTLGDAIVDVDAEGRWSFDCEVPSQWIVWVGERDSTSSQVQRIVVDRAQEYGPVAFGPATVTNVRVIVRNTPARGSLRLVAQDEFGRDLTKSVDLEHDERAIQRREIVETFLAVSAMHITLSLTPDRTSYNKSSQVVTIDPQSASEVVIDLQDLREHEFEVRLNGVPVQGTLMLFRLNESDAETGETTTVDLADGTGTARAAMPGGTYFYERLRAGEINCFRGIVHVSSEPEGRIVKIDWRGRAVPIDGLGKGIELEQLDGMSCAKLSAERREVRLLRELTDTVTTLLVPENCEFKVIEGVPEARPRSGRQLRR